MANFLLFAYESGVCMATLFGIYWIFLRKETYFRFNRFYLLGTIVFSCLIPLVNFRPLADLNLSTSWQLILLVSYLIGIVIILKRMILGIFRVSRLRMGGTSIKLEGYSMVFSKQNMAPFSFFNIVFMNESLLDSFQKKFVLNHELTHVRQLHTYDNIFVEIVLALFWFNPFMWFIRGSLRHTHEYMADEGIRKTDLDLTKYLIILIKQVQGISPLCVSNGFNSMIKSRIRILCRRRSAFLAKLKPLLIIPVALCLTLVFACPNMKDYLLKAHMKAGSVEKLIEIEDQGNFYNLISFRISTISSDLRVTR